MFSFKITTKKQNCKIHMKCTQVYRNIFKLQNVCTEYAKYIKLFNNANQINLLQCGFYGND